MSIPTFARQSNRNGVRSDLTPPARIRGTVENKEFAAFAKRILRAFSRRVAQGDVEALADLLAFAKDIDREIQDAVDGLREFGYSWAEIAARARITRQTAQERWGKTSQQASNALLRNKNRSGGPCSGQEPLFGPTGGGEW